MSDESVLAKYMEAPRTDPRRRPQRGDGPDDSEVNASESFVAMLDLVMPDGRHVGLPYATLVKAEFDPAQGKGIVLRFSTDDVTIEGYRLEPLYRAILQHRAREVRATGRAGEFEKEKDGSGPVVTAIRCEAAS